MLCSLASVAYADNITFDCVLDDSQWYTASQTDAKPESSLTSVTVNSVSLAVSTGTAALQTGGYGDNFYSPNIKIGGTENSWTYTLTFTITEEITTDSIDVALFSTNATAGKQTVARQGKHTLTLSGGSLTDTISVVDKEVEYAGNVGSESYPVYTFDNYGKGGTVSSGSGTVATFAFADGAQTLSAGTYTLTLDARDNGSAGHYVGIAGIQINDANIPEPTTATLSLLALAGMMVRRRRK